MATLILRPVADGNVGHSGGDYTGIAEATADDDSTYIYQSIFSTSTQQVSSSFSFGGFQNGQKIRVTNATLYIRARKTSSASGSRGILAASVGTVMMETKTLGSSYGNYTQNLSEILDTWNASLENGVVPDVSVTLVTGGNLSSSKDSSFQIRITQAYIQIEYEVIQDDTGATAYWKVKGKWMGITVYRKAKGHWMKIEPEDLPDMTYYRKE